MTTIFSTLTGIKCWWNTVSEKRENIGCDLSCTCFWDE